MEIKINLNINDRIVNFVKKMFSGKRLIVSLTVLTLTTGILLYAAPVVIKTFSAGDVISAADVNANFLALKEKIDALEANYNGAPVGTIMAFAGTTVKPNGDTNIPAGWLLCDGKTYSRTGTFSALFNVIFDNWGSGDGVTTFCVPDLRGVFLRGSNKITGTTDRTDGYDDPDFANRYFFDPIAQSSNNSEKIGSFQMDAFQEHTHNIYAAGSVRVSGGGGIDTGNWYSTGSTGVASSGRTTSESRTKNAAVHYIIKY